MAKHKAMLMVLVKKWHLENSERNKQMKRYGNLYSKIWDIENIRTAHLNAQNGKKHYQEVQMVNADPEKYLLEIQAMLRDKTFRNGKYEVFTKTDSGKERVIHKLPYFPDRIVHHCIVQVLEPIWMKTLITDTYAALKGRGIHKGVKRVKEALRDKENTQYCLKFDVRKFYPSVDHAILKIIIRKKIKDADVLWLLDEIIDSTESGVPIGNYLSQFFGNLYLAYFDHWVKEERQCQYYFRYCDDVVVLHSSKEFLHGLFGEIRGYLAANLKLTVKQNHQVFPVDKRGIDFLGYRFFHGYTLLRKGIAKRFKRKMRRIRRNWTTMRSTQVVNGVMSYFGWLRYGNCLHLIRSEVDVQLREAIRITCRSSKTRNPLRRQSWLRVKAIPTQRKPRNHAA